MGELLKGVIRDKVKEGEGSYEAWIEQAKKRTAARLEERRRKGVEVEEDG